MKKDSEIKKFSKIIKNELSLSRYKHSLKVAEIAELLSKQFRYSDPEKAYLAGLLHDITKQKGNEFHISLFKKNKFKKYFEIPESSYHSYSARFYIQEVYRFTNEEIFSAIDSHTLGEKSMSLLQKIIYCSDFLGSEYAQNHKEYKFWLEKTKKILEYGTYLKSSRTIEKLLQKKYDIHENTIAVYKYSILALKKVNL
ncbi:MAG: bis(5'-nucleosyl)-tetraphosphatase (symmetrical) YqeK [Leptospiraceae bacterium]|nr:HD domain-containing protein [Leptospiraceae bacterium]MCK6379746.1 bis(5'-nucleosyl)-tetraphosphatase (symmetrical) YqeK [Leptospiraceae bacterium]NUM40422.1 HD domain-containing protein [Leptospiraceae bacterium]